MNKKTTSNQIRHCTTFLPTRIEATTCKKKTESTTNKILLQLMRQTIQFIQQKPFLQINRKKTFLFLKKQDTENLTQKNRDCISSNH